MILDKKDRVILANQYRILIALGSDDRDTYDRWIEALESGFESAYSEIFDPIYDGLSREECRFVIDVFCMYDAMQRAYKSHAGEEGIKKDAVVFPGFDGNEEPAQHAYAVLVRDRERRFDYLDVESDDLNSHMMVMDMFARMLDVWLTTKRSYKLTTKQLLAILDAQTHPDHRGN